MSAMWLSPSVLALLDEERRALFPRGATAELLPHVTRVRGDGGDWHQIAFSALAEENAEAVIAGEVSHYRALAKSVEWTAYAHDRPADLLARLARHGFTAGPRETVMVLDTKQRPAWLDAPPAHRVIAVEDAEQLRAYAALAREIRGDAHAPIVREIEARLAEGSR